ncbi:MAG TPA: uridine kinase [Cytophagales bacterium]|jgi:uridine kinase|nr:uridine kinase [Cytophagales bacterium]
MHKPYVIGITGGSGSGKTSFTTKLLQAIAPNASVLTLDHYYYPIHLQPVDENGKPNFDEPHSLDLGKYFNDFGRLLKGETLTLKEYTFNNPLLQPKEIVVEPATVLILEGLYVFHLPEVGALVDLKVFIDLNDSEKVARRLKRDAEERGYSHDDVLYSQKHHVTPAYEKYIVKHKHDADIVIPNYPDFEKSLEVLVVFLRTKFRLD